MRIQRIDLFVVELPLVRVFRTSSSTKGASSISSSASRPRASSAGASAPARRTRTTARRRRRPAGTSLKRLPRPRRCSGSRGSRSTSWSDSIGSSRGTTSPRPGWRWPAGTPWPVARAKPLAALLGGTRTEIDSGVSLGIEREVEQLFGLIDQYLAEGYRRIKLKIAPGHDVDVVRRVRERYPEIPLQVDANSAYTLGDLDTVQAARRVRPPADRAAARPRRHHRPRPAPGRAARRRSAWTRASTRPRTPGRRIEIGACRVINIKVSRVGGLARSEAGARRLPVAGVPVWCGGMHEFGIGRAANVAIASLPGFTLPGDVSGSDKYYREDLVEPPIRAVEGLVTVPVATGTRRSSRSRSGSSGRRSGR